MNDLPFQYNDGGRVAAGFFFEREDCTVRAVSNVLGISYHEAHQKCTQAGRRKGHRFTWAKYHALLEKEGLVRDPRFATSCRWTLKNLLPELKSGKYICCVTAHTFAVIDGVVQDTWVQKPGRRVFAVWKKPVSV